VGNGHAVRISKNLTLNSCGAEINFFFWGGGGGNESALTTEESSLPELRLL